jgi:Domain of unknown function (DUF4153)
MTSWSADAWPDEPWPLRPWLLGGLGLLYGTWFYWLGEPPLSKLAPRLLFVLATVPGLALFAFAFCVNRVRWRWSMCFALLLGVFFGALGYWVIGVQPALGMRVDSQVIGPRISAMVLFALLAIPFFQAMQDEPRLHHRLWQLPYSRLHDHSWTDVVLVPAAIMFMALVSLLLILWGQLFKLIGVRFFDDTFAESWFLWPVLTAAWLTGLALLRDWPRVVLPLRRMMLVILSVLAPALAAIALLWIIFLPFTGLAPLWATRKATPILLWVMAFVLLLANAVIRDEAQDEPKSALLRLSGRVLGFALFPLGVIAAISLALRINQYGWTPERCYAVLFLLVALGYAISYCGLLAIRLSRWTESIRPANIKLALAVMALALLVSTPLMDFERVSVRSQMARLLSGSTPVADFDFGALKFHMGKSGLAALTKLRELPSTHPKAAAIKAEVAAADKATDYWAARNTSEPKEERERLARNLAAFDQKIRTYPRGAPLPAGLDKTVARLMSVQCFDAQAESDNASPRCSLVLADVVPGGAMDAIMFERHCSACVANVSLFRQSDGVWGQVYQNGPSSLVWDKMIAALDAGRYSVEPVLFKALQINGQTIFIDPGIASSPAIATATKP